MKTNPFKVKKVSLSEKQLESQILEWLNYQSGIFAFKTNTVGVYDEKKKVFRTNRNPYLMRGTSDIIASVFGQFVAIEVKTEKTIRGLTEPKTETERCQIVFLEKVRKKGGLSLGVCSLEEVQSFIERFKK